MQPVGLPAIAWMPPYVAHVPIATTPHAFGASWSIHQLSVSGCPVASSLPKDVQYPSPLIFSFGIEPSITSTNGLSSSPRAAARNGVRNSSPPGVGDSTLLCRFTLGIPGIAPSSTSSMPGCPAAVTEMESPSQLMPSEIQRMWTSSTPVSVATCHHSHLFQLEGIHQQLLAPQQLEVQARAARAGEREAGPPPLGPARGAAAGRRDVLQLQLRALGRRPLGDQRERQRQCIGDHLAQVAALDLPLGHAASARVTAGDAHDRIGDRQLVHQQILGSGSPTSWSITRLPPNAVSTSTIPGGSPAIAPMSTPAGIAASAASAPSGATIATNRPSLATCIGSIPSSSDAPAPAGATGTSASRIVIATPEARAISLSTDATPPRVASRMQRMCGPAASSSASTSGHRHFVSDTICAARSNSPRASMIAVPCSPIEPDSRMRSPGWAASGASEARGSRRPIPVVVMYMPSAWPRSTTLVSPATILTPASRAAAAIASTSAVSVSASSPSSRISERLSASGRAPATARSLTVPLTASSPIEPPGKRSGLTTNASGVMAICSSPTRSSAASASGARPEPNAGTKRPSIIVCVALPPAP